ncbi:A24 family peptidase [Mycolicibacterium sp. ND9-15]|uniref:A24 family peptidase n=1 Tax=Mycolicibacterium sp. ND9-15 TaxID=3042320 RepID=UPI002DDA8FE8|nr:A24 family peptidase [Mycolicibacterium sp. ND9-15]WSE56642.1 A24 family peptidase [Mycolicibacterium sp. ND9-15]
MGVAGGVVLAWLVALSVFDVSRRRLPNWLTMPGAFVILTAAAVAGRGLPALIGAIALFAVYLSVHLLRPAAMGAGDVKLAIGVGALTGAFGIDVWTLAALGAPLVTAGWAVVAVACHRETTVPHGLSMCSAAAVATALVTI